MSLLFEWDPVKAESNHKKHGVTFAEAATAFADTLSLTIDDLDHSYGEERLILVGESATGHLLVVVHTECGDVIRIISARIATNQERRDYEQA